MKVTFVSLLLALCLFSGCEPKLTEEGAKALEEGLERLYKQSEHEKLVHNLENARMFREQRKRNAQQAEEIFAQLSEAARDVEKRNAEEGHRISTKIKEDVSEDAEQAIDENEQCEEDSDEAFSQMKEIVCVYLRTYIDYRNGLNDVELQKKLDLEIAEHGLKHLLDKCTARMLELFQKGKTLRELRNDIDRAPNNLERLKIAAINCACA